MGEEISSSRGLSDLDLVAAKNISEVFFASQGDTSILPWVQGREWPLCRSILLHHRHAGPVLLLLGGVDIFCMTLTLAHHGLVNQPFSGC